MASRALYLGHLLLALLRESASRGVRGRPRGQFQSMLQVSAVEDVAGDPDPFFALPESDREDIFMRYLPERDVVICGCGKCGSTSLFAYVWRAEFGERWPYPDWPYPQDVMTDRWHGKFENVADYPRQKEIMGHAFTMALIRDPKERLISSWKSKVSCDDDFGVDTNDRARWNKKHGMWAGFVPDLQKLRGKDSNITCMDLKEYATALHEIKQLGRGHLVDRHFLSQDLGCFYRFAPSEWSKVATIGDQEAVTALAAKLHTSNTTIPDCHTSTKQLYIDKETAEMLDKVTEDEYALLGPYLAAESKVKAGVMAL